MTTDYSGDYQGGKRQTCIMREGNITIGTSGTHFAGGLNKLPTWSAAAEIKKGDYVGLHVDDANTYAACHGIPVVILIAANIAIIGRVVTEPEWQVMPAATTSTWATDLGKENYRTAVVEMMNVTAIHAALCEGSTDIDVGAPLAYDISLTAYKDNGTTLTGAFSFHDQDEATLTLCLLGFGAYAVASGDTDLVGIDVVA
jgi:hypothetical protein